MAAPRRFDLEDILNRPGTYFNPETEVLLVVDDAPEVDQDIFEEGAEGGDWVLIGDDVPLDERARDEVIERFEVRHHPGATSAPAEDDFEDEEEELEPDDEQPELQRLRRFARARRVPQARLVFRVARSVWARVCGVPAARRRGAWRRSARGAAG